MSKADVIRGLAAEGLPVAEIARRVGVRYQHVYGVLRDAGILPTRITSDPAPLAPSAQRIVERSGKPALTTAILQNGGFKHVADWHVVDGALGPNRPLPRDRGVYAFVRDEAALYVGLATMGLAKRLYFYGRPGSTQRTSQRINEALRGEIAAGARIGIHVALPADLSWNGLPVAGDAGLELGLIRAHALPWNIRSANAVAGASLPAMAEAERPQD